MVTARKKMRLGCCRKVLLLKRACESIMNYIMQPQPSALFPGHMSTKPQYGNSKRWSETRKNCLRK